jgi:hypothetical protein
MFMRRSRMRQLIIEKRNFAATANVNAQRFSMLRWNRHG